MKKFIYVVVALVLVITIYIFSSSAHVPTDFVVLEKEATIFPDYSAITIPINMSPLNFAIKNPGEKFSVKLSTESQALIIETSTPDIRIPKKKWDILLTSARNGKIFVDIFVKTNGEWVKFKTIENQVVAKPIDKYIAFRKINAGYILWQNMGIYQRNLENYTQSPILLNDETDNNCMHCHTFCKNDPEKMLIHLRASPSGTLLYNNGELKFINTASDYTMSAGVYPSWHPNGNLVAFSVNRIKQVFPSFGHENVEVSDNASDIVVYDIAKNMLTTSPKLSTKDLENIPAWSHDGRYLYYISSNDYDYENPAKAVMYDLLRIAYNEQSGEWGAVDTLLRSSDTGKSISFPEISPDGKHLLFCMSDFGYFTIHRKSSDLYMLHLDDLHYERLAVNSDDTESFHSWSSNSEWFCFVSKRLDGLYSRVYFSHVDENGQASKPFILPQDDPDYYDFQAWNYNRPVFIKDKVTLDSYKLSNAAYSEKINASFDPSVDIDALSGATKIDEKMR